jgi:hypothetical protein
MNLQKKTNWAKKKNQEAEYHIFQIMHGETVQEAWDILNRS